MLTKSMAVELAATGVRVNAVCPASVDAPFLRGFALPADADMQLLMRSVSPMGRLITGRGRGRRHLPGVGRRGHGQRYHARDRRGGERLIT